MMPDLFRRRGRHDHHLPPFFGQPPPLSSGQGFEPGELGFQLGDALG
jgi:hypothetical protein